jgi:predicted amidophosphoribosyltransferase
MKLSHPPKTLPDGNVEPAHDVTMVCANCGYDLDEAELAADTCSDCGAPLNLKQSVAIQVTTLPPIFGSTL